MSEQTTIVCDSCGKQAKQNDYAILPPTGWYHVRRTALGSSSEARNFHFCSPTCLHHWAASERPERKAA